jgi:hypothetical protein
MTYNVGQESLKFRDIKSRNLTRILTRIVKILDKFTDNYEKRLNFTKLSSYLKLNPSEVDEIITLILTFQELFTRTFNTHIVKKKIIDTQIFLTTEPKLSKNFIPIKIKLSSGELNLLSDIIYMFKHVKRGKGFDVKTNGTELLSNIKELWNYHPYFFEVHENGLMYPSEFGLKLGELILSYKKSGKIMESMLLDDHKIMVVKN